MRARRPTPADELSCRPTTFMAGAHAVVVAKLATSGRWTLSVDGRPADMTYESEVDAWEAGVRAADRLDHPDPAGVR